MQVKTQVLVVDDDLDFIGELARVLDDTNIEIKAADSLEIMFQRIKNLHPDILVLDVGVEHDSVGKLTDILKSKSETYSIPTLLLIGKTSINRLLYINGLHDYMIKPFHIEDFVATIKKITVDHVEDYRTQALPAF